MSIKKRIAALFAVCIVFLSVMPTSRAMSGDAVARDITHECTITLNHGEMPSSLTDGNTSTYMEFNGATFRIRSNEPIGGIYVLFDQKPTVWGMYYGQDTMIRCGENKFLHEYHSVDMDDIRFLSLDFPSPNTIADIFVLSKGSTLPDFVQDWKNPSEQCDIMLFPCHSDDDQLFFAGAIPDAVARGARVQVCLFTNHFDTHSRQHELLDGLWECGLDRYPDISPMLDTMRAYSEEEALHEFSKLGFSYDDIVAYQTALIRKYKPTIVLAHDTNGEYGHGAHILSSRAVCDAVLKSSDPGSYTASALEYGVWDVPKTYIHLYDQNTIDFEIDMPLDLFNGKSAFSVSQEAFKKHVSQSKTPYAEWLLGSGAPIERSTEITDYSPRKYGLWRSTIGDDTLKKDFYDNTPLKKSASDFPALTTEAPTQQPLPTPEATAPSTVPVGSVSNSPLLAAVIIFALLVFAAFMIWLIIKFN